LDILIAEDDILLADFLVEELEEQGHVVCGIASSVAHAIELARLHRPHAGIFDMQLRDSECGSDIAQRLEELGELGQMAVLYVTGESDRVFHAATVGHACLNKPYRFSALKEALEIVRDIACEGATSRPLPGGLQLLNNASGESDDIRAGADDQCHTCIGRPSQAAACCRQ
jgi:DNA-binding response OmpR family regulator